MMNQKPNKELMLEQLEETKARIEEVNALIQEARLNASFDAVANLYNIKLGLESLVLRSKVELQTLEQMEKEQEKLEAQKEADANKQSN